MRVAAAGISTGEGPHTEVFPYVVVALLGYAQMDGCLRMQLFFLGHCWGVPSTKVGCKLLCWEKKTLLSFLSDERTFLIRCKSPIFMLWLHYKHAMAEVV